MLERSRRTSSHACNCQGREGSRQRDFPAEILNQFVLTPKKSLQSKRKLQRLEGCLTNRSLDSSKEREGVTFTTSFKNSHL